MGERTPPRRAHGDGVAYERAAGRGPVPRSTQAEPLVYDAPMFGLDTVVVLLIVLAVVLVWRGPKTLPKWGEALGRGVRAARKEADGLRRDRDGTDGPGGVPKP